MEKIQPTLSLKERDRRWELVRGFLKEEELDCLIFAGLNAPQRHERFLSNEHRSGIVVFPREGAPVYLVRSNMDVVSNMENLRRGQTSWIADWRGGATGETLVDALKDKGFDSAVMGVFGLKGQGIIMEPEGWIPYQTWDYVLKHLPDATFKEVTKSLIEMILVKGEEELAMLRHAARIGEMACEAMMEVTRPGVSEGEIYSTIMQEIRNNGANCRDLIIHSGDENPSWGPPRWINTSETPRSVQPGEHVLVEMFPSYGGMQTQQQMTVALKPVSPEKQELADLAKRSMEIGHEMLRPGNTFEEVCDAMEAPILKAGCWHLTPLIHSINPLQMVSQRQVGMIDNLPGLENYNPAYWQKGEYKGKRSRPLTGGDVIIQPGMCFAMEPNACRGKRRVNIGGTVIVTEDDVETLNTLANEMQIV